MNPQPHMLPRIAFAFLLYFTLTSCTYLSGKKLRDTEDRVQQDYLLELLKQQDAFQNTETTTLNWKQALRQTYLRNTACLRAHYGVEDAKVRQKQIWRQFIPGLNLGVSESFEVGEFTSAFANPALSINSFLALGNLLNLPRNTYERKLFRSGAELGEQHAMRQQIISLYRLFEAKRLWELEGEGLKTQARFVQILRSIDPIEGRKKLRLIEDRQKSWHAKGEQQLARVATFFNVYPGQIDLKTNTPPSISYRSDQLNFEDSKRWGQLQLKILALRELAEEGRIKQAYLRYLPSASLGLSAPPVYNNNSTEGFDPQQIRFNPGVNWSLDTNGSIGQQVRRLRRDTPIKNWEKDRRRRQEIRKLIEGRELLKKTEEQLKNSKKLKEEYIGLIRKGLVEHSPEQALTNLQKLYREQIQLDAKQVEISTHFWLIDEAWWSKFNRPWKAVWKKEKS